jgi:23S rRNA (cytidine1920-2'-O)/16S rRNA (cytidine1409-2'-O)-methyltransferase
VTPGERPRPGRKERLDRLLVDRGHARSRERAQALVLAGRVLVDGRPAGKPGGAVPLEARIEVRVPDHPFVGRGGVKLEGALAALGIDPAGRTALDVGASTGGFTDCLLRRGARRVMALDVGAGQLDWSLRRDPRVTVIEGVNARYLKVGDLPETPDLVAIDVSFISLRLILPALRPLLAPRFEVVALVKPQFEVGRRDVGPGGIVTDPALHRSALLSVAREAERSGFAVIGGCPSPITGAEGNREFFLHLGEAGGGRPDLEVFLGGIVDAGSGSAA